MKSYQPGDKAYIIVNNRLVSPVTVVRNNGNLYVIKFENGGGVQVRDSRLYKSQIEAMAALPNNETKRKLWMSHYEAGL